MTFKVCTVGCGRHASRYHGPSYAAYVTVHPDIELAACCDLNEARARRFRDCFGFSRWYLDLERMLDEEKPDAVCMIVPEALTCKLSCRVLEKGYPLVMEKPPGRAVAEIDRMIAAADASGAPTQVAFNRRYIPLVQELKRLLRGQFAPENINHIRYDFARVGRMDADFSLTAIHGIDAVRFLAGSDYEHVRFHYQNLVEVGPTVANVSMECTLGSGATVHLSFHPLSGVIIERATIHARDHTFFLELPMWSGIDTPGKLQHYEKGELKLELTGLDLYENSQGFRLMGFYAENACFFDDLRAGRRPEGDLRNARQSVEVAQYMRERRSEYYRA